MRSLVFSRLGKRLSVVSLILCSWAVSWEVEARITASCDKASQDTTLLCQGASQDPVSTGSAQANLHYARYVETVQSLNTSVASLQVLVANGKLDEACTQSQLMVQQVRELADHQAQACQQIAAHCMQACGTGMLANGQVGRQCTQTRDTELAKSQQDAQTYITQFQQMGQCSLDVGV